MNAMTLNSESLSAQLGREISEVLVVIAKNEVSGLPPESISKLLGVSVAELQEIQESQDYKDVRLLLGAETAKLMVEKDSSWDAIEAFSLKRLSERLPAERDTDTLLKIAAVANKAQRRNQPMNQVLDPQQGVARVPLRLTRRMTERLNSDGSREREEVQSISLLHGSAENPSFAEIDSALGISLRPRTIEHIIPNQSDDFDVDDLVYGGS